MVAAKTINKTKILINIQVTHFYKVILSVLFLCIVIHNACLNVS